MNVFDSSPAPC